MSTLLNLKGRICPVYVKCLVLHAHTLANTKNRNINPERLAPIQIHSLLDVHHDSKKTGWDETSNINTINSLAPFNVLITNYLDYWDYLIIIEPMMIAELLEK